MPAQKGIQPSRTIAAMAATALLAVVLAWGIRHRLIEPVQMAAWCDMANPGWQCVVRRGAIWWLTDQRLGWLALLLGAAAQASRFKPLESLGWVAWPAWVGASLGLVLYNAELAAPSLLLAGLSIVRRGGFRRHELAAIANQKEHKLSA